MKKGYYFLPLLMLLAACSKGDGPYSDISGDYVTHVQYRYYGSSSSRKEDSTVIDYEGTAAIRRIMMGKISITWTTANLSEASVNLDLVRDTPDSFIFEGRPPSPYYQSQGSDLRFDKASKRFIFSLPQSKRSSPNYWTSETYTLQAQR